METRSEDGSRKRDSGLVAIPLCLWAAEDACQIRFEIVSGAALLPLEAGDAPALLHAIQDHVAGSRVASRNLRVCSTLSQCTHLLTISRRAIESCLTDAAPRDWMSPIIGYRLSQFQSAGTLLPPVERIFTSLLIAGRTMFVYGALFAIDESTLVPRVVDWAPLDLNLPYHLMGQWPRKDDPYLTDEPVTHETLQSAKVIYAALSECAGKRRRPLAAADVFHRALVQGDWSTRLLLLAVALEALVQGEGESEIAHQVCERAASLLRPPGEERAALYETVKEIYRLRSRLVHGVQPIRPAWKEDLEHFGKVLRSAEDCVRAALQRVLTDKALIAVFCGPSAPLKRFFQALVLGGAQPDR